MRLWLFLLPLIVMASCNSSNKMVGGHKDAHGCLVAAGYTWSTMLKDCIRPWESGTRVLNAQDSAATTAAFAVFSPDRRQVELFLPSISTHPLLDQQGTGWRSGPFSLTEQDGKLSLYHRERLIYVQE